MADETGSEILQAFGCDAEYLACFVHVLQLLSITLFVPHDIRHSYNKTEFGTGQTGNSVH